ncbi:MAG: hypothetical protein HOV81_23800 [Kofleriaceae bacterium]|nr:hypothetical protein [Kofleriaceae bacterium]
MARRNRIIFLAALSLAACGSKKDVQHAKRSLYDTEFTVVYNAALDATRELYPTLNDNPGPGKISTAWHQVAYANNQDDLSNQRTLAQQQGVAVGQDASSPTTTMAGVPTRLAYKRYFIRFDVSVLGGRPWRVKVIGHASEWDPGAAMPSEMKGAQRPSWLDARTDSLQLAIYKRIKQFAVPMKEEVQIVVEDPKTDPSTFAGVPAGAAKQLAAIKDLLGKRDYVGLRPVLDDDVVWSLGGGTGADVALATWQADPGTFESMSAAIEAGCGSGADKKVTCPEGPAKRGVYQLVLDDKGGAWKVTSFVKAE